MDALIQVVMWGGMVGMEKRERPHIQVGNVQERRGKGSRPWEAAGREQGGEDILGAGVLCEGLREAREEGGEEGERRRVPRARTRSLSSLP